MAETAREVIARAILDTGRCMGALAHTCAETFEVKIADLVISALTTAGYRILAPGQFVQGERVTKIKGSSWTGRVVGFYSTILTPEGYCVESENEPGSVQIYPASAIRSLKDDVAG